MDSRPLSFDKPPFSTYDVNCPNCRFQIRLINNEKTPNYWKDLAEGYKARLKRADNVLLSIDEWCLKHIGDTYTASMFRDLKDKFLAEDSDAHP